MSTHDDGGSGYQTRQQANSILDWALMSQIFPSRKKTSNTDDTSTAKPSLKVLSIPSKEKAKWTSIPDKAKSLLLESMSYSSRYGCVNCAS